MRSFLCLVVVILFVGNAELKAQYYDKTVGIRVGTSIEFSYKQFIFYTPHIQMAVEGLIGFQADEDVWMVLYDEPINNGFITEGLWLLHLDLGFDTNFSGFAGAGIYLGAYTETALKPAFFGGGATISVGVEYTFSHAPISISLDWKPIFGYPRFSLARGALTFRYILATTWQ